MSVEERALRLAGIAQQLRDRLRRDPPANVHRWLRRTMAGEDFMALSIVAAAMVTPGRPLADLAGWVEYLDPDPDLVDEVAVQRAMAGEPVRLNGLETGLVVFRLSQRGLSQQQIAARLGMSARNVVRYRERPQWPRRHRRQVA